MSTDASERPSTDRHRSESVLSGAGVMMFQRYLVAGLGWVGTLIIIRQLPPEAWGGYSFIFGLAGVLGIVSDLHIGRIVLRMVMDDQEDAGSTITSYIVLRTLLGVASGVLGVAIVVIGGYSAEVVLGMVVAGVVMTLAAAHNALGLLFQSRLWFRDMAIAAIIGQVAQTVLIFAIAYSGQGTLVWFAVPAVFFAGGELVWLYLKSRHLLRWSVQTHYWWPWLKEAAPLALGAAAASLYFKIDMVMLAELDSLTAVGQYSIGYKFSDLLGSFAYAVTTPVLTLLVAALPSDIAAFRRSFHQGFVLLLVGAVGVSIGFAGWADDAIALLYGDHYLPSAGASRLLVVGQSINFFTILLFTALVAVGRNRLYAVATVSGVGVNIALNFLLIPDRSFFGSAIATVITEVLVMAVLAAGSASIPGVRPLPWRSIAVVVSAGTVMAVMVACVHDAPWWPLAAVASGGLYLAVLHVGNVAGPGGLKALAQSHEALDLGPVEDPA